MLLNRLVELIALLVGSAAYFKFVGGQLTGYPDSQNPPNGLIAPAGNIDFSELTLSLMNDFVLMAQVFVTCIPSMVLAATTPLFVKVSCSFNLLSVLSLLALGILDGWDRLDESGPFRFQMKGLFESWAQNHTVDASDMTKRDLPSIRNPFEEVCKNLGLHADMYVRVDTLKNQRMICSSFEVSHSSFFHKPLFQEMCVTKKGLTRFGKNRLTRMPINTTRKLANFLIHGGIIKTAINPPLYLFNIIQAYGEYAEEVTQKMYEMITVMNSKTWDGADISLTLHEDEKLLMSITYRRGGATIY
ncbi:hypothetical protein HG535_0B05500 [Zygotorulaspora mrakii]|uniref:Uncharacterized protein n=1 Tax=Zygotorulaspora mrakii TaxID=42260 RepID=A0A7H9AYM4_ZYGMR|nr:uncharacterized protein HG535_0B05500 [Zygotorulaspora mrakii]QLG71508.1 hypothetical protein HG535_0B05500 [Zygotorulaspora mrakii]